MGLSYWEYKHWFSNIDYCVVGSGIVGLTCAIQLKQSQPRSKVIVLERGVLPNGASTKNAGFACFGSISELIHDLYHSSEESVYNLVDKRVSGLQKLRQLIGEHSLGYQNKGGFELFLEQDTNVYQDSLERTDQINQLLKPLFSSNAFQWINNKFNFSRIKPKICYTPFEGQIDTGMMMKSLLHLASSLDIDIFTGLEVESFEDQNNFVNVKTKHFSFNSKRLFLATNGFTHQFYQLPLEPARAQVLITKPIKDLRLDGSFHFDKGYYYFRMIDNRILLGGGRNLDFRQEKTTDLALNPIIQEKLEKVLTEIIVPNQSVEIEHRWTGIMGTGNKSPIVKKISNTVFLGVRLGGMGVAIGSQIGYDLALLNET